MAIGRNRLHPAQYRTILDFAGAMPIMTQPNKVTELRRLASAFRAEAPEEYNRAYDIIVNHVLPEGSDVTTVVAHKVGELLDKHIEERSKTFVFNVQSVLNNTAREESDKITEKALKAAEEITALAREEIEKAKKDFITIKVQVGNKKAKKIDGIVCEQFETLLQLAQQRLNIMMVGPAGCGKTHIAGQIADALGLDYASQSCSAGMSESQLTGWLLPIGKGSAFSYVSSEFVRIYENGGVFLLDEIDAADPNVLIFINQALSNGKFSLPQRFDNPVVKRHKDFVAIAAANTFGGGADAMYHARNALDAATLDRFRIGMVAIDYSTVVEEKLINQEVLKWGWNVRLAIHITGMRKLMSTRAMIDASKMMEGQGWTMKQVAAAYFADWTPEELLSVTRNDPATTEPLKKGE